MTSIPLRDVLLQAMMSIGIIEMMLVCVRIRTVDCQANDDPIRSTSRG